MKDKKKWIIGISACVLLIVSVFFVFNQGKSNEQVVTEYFELLKKKDYKQMYQMLNPKIVYTPTQKYFVEKYKEFYEEIDAKNIQIKILDEQDSVIEYLIYIDTLAGRITYRNKVGVKDEQIQFNKNLIMDGYTDGCKIKITTYNPEKRGRILDRNGKVLAEDGKGYSVGLVKGKLNGENDYGQIAQYLETDVETLQKKMSASWINDDSFVPIKTVSEATKNDLINKNILGINGVKISTVSIRTYPYDKVASHIVGYVQNVNAEDLKKHKNEGYNSTSVIGRSGIEAAYEEKLRGITSGKIDLVDKNDKVIKELCHKKVKMSPQDITLTIDIDLQQSLYNEYQNDKSASVALNPKTGEVLALVSAPSYDSNMFTTYVTKTKAAEREANNYTDQINRFSKTYAPGSTMKLLTASIGLNNGIINADESVTIDSQSWQKDSSWGNYFITRVNNITAPITLREAAKYSDNIYFAQLALKIGSENLINGIKGFGIGEELTFEYPMTNSSISNNGSLDSEILLADTGYGQGELMVTPLNMALAYSALANDGNIMNPRLVLTSDSSATVWKESAIKSEYLPTLIEDFSAMVNDADGSAHSAKIDGFNIAAKTGTAEIKASQDDTTGTENGWFVAVDTTSSKLAVAMIVEDVKDRGGSSIPIPKVKAIMEEYLNR